MSDMNDSEDKTPKPTYSDGWVPAVFPDPKGVKMRVDPITAGSTFSFPDGRMIHSLPISAGSLAQTFTRLEAVPHDGLFKRGMRKWRIDRANALRALKDKHPKLSQVALANLANEKLSEEIRRHRPVTQDDVRNDYRDMDWDWERSDRIR